MKGYSFRSLTDLVLKIFKTKVNAGTGLSGGGSLEADRTLTVNYGTTAGTATQGNDSRVVNAASNATVNAKEAALEAKKADKAITITAGTGLSGGGTLDANRTLTVSYGTAAGTAAQGNDSRITGALQSSQVVQTTGTSTTSVMSQKAATDQLTTKAALSHTHPWAQVTGQPAQATRWPTFAEVTGKPTHYPTTWASVAAQPATATRWPTWAEVTSKPVGAADPWPVGACYTQYPDTPAPATLFGGTWKQLFNTEGVFFRTEGGGASGFGGGVQGDDNKSHTHTASTNSTGGHAHTASTNSTGAHTHTLSGTAASAGEHTHALQKSRSGNNSTGDFVSPANKSENTTTTNSAGAHTHTISGTAASAGAHTHTVSVGTAGAHAHTVTVAASGGTEARPKNRTIRVWQRTA